MIDHHISKRKKKQRIQLNHSQSGARTLISKTKVKTDTKYFPSFDLF